MSNELLADQNENLLPTVLNKKTLHAIAYNRPYNILTEWTFELSSATILAPTPGMEFKLWDHIDRYLDAYCNSQKFSKVIYGAEYDNGL
ncbi:hypothetical protein F8M41_025693 [Gigaspora margarita]|uniref:Uncharacterized protein n=1 Tax=Gigaspora margarita TaxID=4874 RepID=A0A8H4AZZ6_GIGMA|nr:hypothetical protein F8M41_025693 [Gigaspora margarita]